jgi:hypothetical protein
LELLELLEINDVALDGHISFLWWSWVGHVYLLPSGNLKEAEESFSGRIFW